MEGELALMGKYIGAGLATIGLGGAGIGVGHVAGNFLAGALRNPSAAARSEEHTSELQSRRF
jgi:F-type H+-transporting ATPase subunit c